MEFKDDFELYEAVMPAKRADIRRKSLVLRRNGVTTLEEIRRLFMKQPDTLSGFRGIRSQGMTLITEILDYYSTL